MKTQLVNYQDFKTRRLLKHIAQYGKPEDIERLKGEPKFLVFFVWLSLWSVICGLIGYLLNL